MKATGIVRRIDDLGRVVIPKEIRRSMKIREGDPLEIYTTNDGCVCFRKYSPLGEFDPIMIKKICESLFGKTAYAVFDRDGQIIAAYNYRDELDEDKALPIRYDCDIIGFVQTESDNAALAAALVGKLMED
jgi:AbrB family transcriptional regulator (stage V sporulation protein T)